MSLPNPDDPKGFILVALTTAFAIIVLEPLIEMAFSKLSGGKTVAQVVTAPFARSA